MRNSQEWVPHSYLLGHLIETGKIMARFPRDMYPLCIATLMLQKYPHLEKYGFIVLDAWPFVPPMIYVFDPDMSSQFTQVHSLPKSDDLKSEFRPLTQNKDLVTLDGQAWKFWRSVFNPGFSVKNLISLTPAFLEEIRLFSDRLRAAAKSGEVLKLEDHAVNLTIDVIGRSILYVFLPCSCPPVTRSILFILTGQQWDSLALPDQAESSPMGPGQANIVAHPRVHAAVPPQADQPGPAAAHVELQPHHPQLPAAHHPGEGGRASPRRLVRKHRDEDGPLARRQSLPGREAAEG
jgi:hypothetical protein